MSDFELLIDRMAATRDGNADLTLTLDGKSWTAELRTRSRSAKTTASTPQSAISDLAKMVRA